MEQFIHIFPESGDSDMFIGEYAHAIDAKGRIIVPAKFREELGIRFIVTKGFDNKCLYVYTLEQWNILENKIKTLPTADPTLQRFVRFFFSGAIECEADSQGRVSITPTLRSFANLTKEIVSIGVSSRVEIWDKNAWDEYNQANFIDVDMASRLAELGI